MFFRSALFASNVAVMGGSTLISYVGVSDPAVVASGDLTFVEPAGVQSGDLLVACCCYRSTAAFTAAASWAFAATQLSTGNVTVDGAGSIASSFMAYIVRGGSAPDLVFPRTAGDVALGRIIAFRGAHATPLDAGNSATLASAGTGYFGTGVTTAEANEVLVMACCSARPAASSAQDCATDPAAASWTEVADSTTTSGADCGLAIAWAPKAAAGATGNFRYTAASSARHSGQLAAFKKA